MKLLKTLSKLAVLTLGLQLPATAMAFDLEDYHTTFRATRDAWFRAYAELRDALPEFLAARHLAELWGLDMTGYDRSFGYELPPAWCDSWQGETVGHNMNLGFETLNFSGTLDFFGRGHDLHKAGRGLGHHHDTTLVGDDKTVADYIEHSPLLQWRDRFIPGTSERVADMIEAALAYYEETGHPRVTRKNEGCEYWYYCSGSATDQLCKKCSPCPEGARCDGATEQVDGWYFYGDHTPAYECTTDTGQPGFVEYTACEGEPSYDFPTFEQALATLLSEQELTLPEVPLDKCEPGWYHGEVGCLHGDPTEWCLYTEGREMLDRVFTAYRASRDRMLKAQNEFSLSIAPFKAATAAYAAAVEAYHSNNPCGGYMLPNLPNIPDMPGPAGEPL